MGRYLQFYIKTIFKMKIVKKIKIYFYFFVILTMSYLIIDLLSLYLIGVNIKIGYIIFDIVVLIFWIDILYNSITNKDDKSKTIID